MPSARHALLAGSLSLAAAIAACGASDSSPAEHAPASASAPVQRVRVTVDGVAAFGAAVSQGGSERRVTTNGQGEADVPLETSIPGEAWIVASVPSARARASKVDTTQRLELELHAFSTVDDPT